jgi:hypothetical protein
VQLGTKAGSLRPTGGVGAVARAQALALWSAIRQPSIWQPALFIFGWLAMPSADSAFLYFMTDELHLSAEFLGRIRFLGSIASLAAIVVYQRALSTVPVSRVLLGCTLASSAFGLVQIALATHANRAYDIPDSWLALGDDVLLTALAELAHMPVLVLAARLCPPGVEGTLFATLMSVYNAGGTVGSELGSALTALLGVGSGGGDAAGGGATDFANLPLLLMICSAAKLLPLPFLQVLDLDSTSAATAAAAAAASADETFFPEVNRDGGDGGAAGWAVGGTDASEPPLSTTPAVSRERLAGDAHASSGAVAPRAPAADDTVTGTALRRRLDVEKSEGIDSH